MASSQAWTRQQLLTAFGLYCQLPFGKLHARNPQIIHYAERIERTPSALAMKLVNIASLDPSIINSGRVGLKGASKADQAMWNEMQADWLTFSMEVNKCMNLFDAGEVDSTEVAPEENAEQYIGRTKTTQVNVRIGQLFFRKAVLSAYDNTCCITGLSEPRLLIASHIIPWKDDENNRLNPSNGLCLSALHDKAFDIGLISLDADFRVIVSPALCTSNNAFLVNAILSYAGRPVSQPSKFKLHKDFITYHREHVYQG